MPCMKMLRSGHWCCVNCGQHAAACTLVRPVIPLEAGQACWTCLSRGVIDASQKGVLKGDPPSRHLEKLLTVLQESVQRVRLCTAPALSLRASVYIYFYQWGQASTWLHMHDLENLSLVLRWPVRIAEGNQPWKL